MASPELARALQITEVDNPTTQLWKQRRLEQLNIHKPSNLTFLPIDFERQSLIDGLREGGYPLEKPAFISWLGVTQYLTRSAVLGTLKQVSKLASGTELVFTFIVPEGLLDNRERRVLSIVKASMSAVGEPWISFFDTDELTSILKDLASLKSRASAVARRTSVILSTARMASGSLALNLSCKRRSASRQLPKNGIIAKWPARIRTNRYRA